MIKQDFNSRVIRNTHPLNLVKNTNTLLRCNIFGLKNNDYSLSNHMVQTQLLFLFLVREKRIIVDKSTESKILSGLLVHDLGELIVGDTPSPSKTEDFISLEAIYYNKIASDFLTPKDLVFTETETKIMNYIDSLELFIECQRMKLTDPGNFMVSETLLQLTPYLFGLEEELLKTDVLKRYSSERTLHDSLLVSMKLREDYASWN